MRKILGFVILPLIAIGLAACGGVQDSGVATASGASAASSTASGPPPAADPAARQRQYTECLRQHGISLPDPEQGKEVRVSEPNQAKVKEAAQACQQYAPSVGSTKGGDPSELREYASCMRENGVPDFPDPDPDAGLVIPKNVVNSANFKAADRVCGGNTGKPGSGPTK